MRFIFIFNYLSIESKYDFTNNRSEQKTKIKIFINVAYFELLNNVLARIITPIDFKYRADII